MRSRTSPVTTNARERVHAELDRLLDALEFDYDMGTFRERLLDAASEYAYDVHARRAIQARKTGRAA